MSMSPRALLLAGGMLFLLAGCGKGDQPAGAGGPGGAMPPPEVGVIVAKAGTVPLQAELVGRLAPYRSADVRARIPGVLQKRVYAEGTDVREGQVLFVVDPSTLRAELGQAQAALAQAQASYANARSAADRARQLMPQKYISKSDYDNALATERSAAAAVQAGKASVDSAQINLGFATVRAPIPGRAGRQQVTEGALVGQDTATLLTTIDQIDQLYVNFSMGVSELAKLRALPGHDESGTQVSVYLPDGSLYEHRGALDFSADVVDPATGSVSLRALIPNPDLRLLPGTYVTLKATLGQVPNAFLIPQTAVLRDAQGPYVLVVGQDGKVARLDIDADRNQGDQWIVTKGLRGGEQVIVSGLQRSQPGQPAKAVPWQPDGAPAAAGKPAGATPADGNANPDAKKQDAAAGKQD